MSQRDKPRQGVVANTLKFSRNGASLLANPFGVGFIEWLGIGCALAIQLNLVSIRIADINEKPSSCGVGSSETRELRSAAGLLCHLWRDQESEMLPASWALAREQRQTLSAYAKPGLLRSARIER